MQVTPNQAEETLLIPFSKLQKHDLSRQMAEDLIRIMCMNENQAQGAWNDMRKEMYQIAIIAQRLTILQVKIHFRVLILIASICNGNPGTSILYLYYCQYYAKQCGIKEVSLDTFCQNMFAMGFPKQQDMFDLWDKSKFEGKPILDIGAACQSIIFENK